MKAVINENETKSRYPYLGVLKSDKSVLVLFSGDSKGTVLVSSNDDWENIGEYGERWAEDKFTPFTGSITLSND